MFLNILILLPIGVRSFLVISFVCYPRTAFLICEPGQSLSCANRCWDPYRCIPFCIVYRCCRRCIFVDCSSVRPWDLTEHREFQTLKAPGNISVYRDSMGSRAVSWSIQFYHCVPDCVSTVVPWLSACCLRTPHYLDRRVVSGLCVSTVCPSIPTDLSLLCYSTASSPGFRPVFSRPYRFIMKRL